MQTSLSYITSMASQGIFNFIEGGDEEDDAAAINAGNSLAQAASFQQKVYATGHANGIAVINMSFGQGWHTSTTGDYGTVGNLAAYADYANAHTYPGTGNPPLSAITALGSDAQLAAVGKPVITTEFGYYTNGSATDPTAVTQTVQAKYLLDGLFDAYAQGDAKTYIYELLDEGGSSAGGNFGLFTSSGTPKLAATAIHNVTSLLSDSGGSFTPGTLGYSLTGTLSTDHSVLLEKSDGSFWLALWNEARLSGPTSPTPISVANHTVTLSLANTASQVEIFDPLTGTGAIQTASNTGTVSISLPDHPILVEIVPGSTSSTGSGNPAPTPADIAINLPAAPTITHGTTTLLTGISISDAWASTHAGSMALSVSDTAGTLAISNGSSTLTGQSVHLSGSLAQLNADLATLHYEATTLIGVDHVTVTVYNQAGVSSSHALTIALI
jgi:hypothetical protein